MKKSAKIKAGIIGGAGYTGGELIRILINHPGVDVSFVHSKSNAGKAVHEIHTDLIGETELVFTDIVEVDPDVMFLCLGHGDSKEFLRNANISPKTRIVDLSHDFRIKGSFNAEEFNREFTYGLPELNKETIRKAENIANPGCFATCIELSLLPLAYKHLLDAHVHVSGITGSTGAGRSLSETSHFSWRNNNVSAYKIMEHQHLKEIYQSVRSLQKNLDKKIYFVPYRGNFTRGIMTTSYLNCGLELREAMAIYKSYYHTHPFVHITDTNPSIKQVVNTNKCILHLEKHDNVLVIISTIDNLLKGASGQAVQNMNLMFGLDEKAGLIFKTVNF
jgi:N-acetyl-gamma-glutamyl-phosphate reductase